MQDPLLHDLNIVKYIQYSILALKNVYKSTFKIGGGLVLGLALAFRPQKTWKIILMEITGTGLAKALKPITSWQKLIHNICNK